MKKNIIWGDYEFLVLNPARQCNAEVHALKWTPVTTKTDDFYDILLNKYLYTLKIIEKVSISIRFWNSFQN